MTLKAILFGAATIAISATTASAGCNGGAYCSDSSHSSSSYDLGTTTVSGTSYASNSYTTNTYAGVASDAYADAKYGSGSISAAYSDTSYIPYNDSMPSVPGLGANEKLCPVACASPVTTSGSVKGKILGCYAVCQTAPKVTPVTTTSYTQVVRPVIYVRYPVPYAVPYSVPGHIHYSRYGSHSHGGFGYNQGFAYQGGFNSGGYGYPVNAAGHGGCGYAPVYGGCR